TLALASPGASGSLGNSKAIVIVTAMTVMVGSPNGGAGQNLLGGSTQNITWESTGAPTTINLYYTSNEAWIPIATGEDNDGTYAWTVPAIISSEAKVKVEGIKAGMDNASDESNAVFTIGGKTVYVKASGGDDSRNAVLAGSQSTPWKTISKAVAYASGECTINVLEGTYNAALGESFPIILSTGVNLKSIASPTTNAIIDSGDWVDWGNYFILKLGGSSTVDGFSIFASGQSRYAVQTNGNGSQILNNNIILTGSSVKGLYISSGNTTTKISGNTIHVSDDGIYLNGTNTATTIQNNFISAETSSCVNIIGGADDLIISGNTLEAHVASQWSYASGINVQGTALNSMHILNNTIKGYGSSSPYGINFSVAATGTIESNEIISFAKSSSGYGIYISGGTIRINNNNILKNKTGIYVGSGTITASDNIISAGPALNGCVSGSVGIYRASGTVTSEYNDVHNNATNYTSVDQGTNDITTNPKFVNVSTDNYQLCSDSPCIGDGTGGANIGRNLGVSTEASGYVANSYVNIISGNNTTGNGSEANPWKTLAYAGSKTRGIIYIRAGTYSTPEGETIPIGMGTGQTLIRYQSEVVTLDAEGVIKNIILGGNSNTVEGLVIKNPASGGMGGSTAGYAVSLGTNCRVINNTFLDDGTGSGGNYFYGISVGSDSTISGNNITFTGPGYGIYLSSSDNTSILNNNITTGRSPIGNFNGSATGANVLIQGNSLECTGDSYYGINLATATNFNIINNTIIGPGGTSGSGGISLNSSYGTVESNTIRGFCAGYGNGYGVYHANYSSGTVEVVKNTIVKNNIGIYNGAGNLIVKNNIIASEVGGYDYSGSVGLSGTITSTYNDVYANDTSWSSCSSGEGDIVGDPLFANATSNIYTLEAGSPCINAGTPEGTEIGRYAFAAAPDITSPTVEITAPNGGEKIKGGAAYSITFTATDESGIKTNSLAVWYSLDDGGSWTSITSEAASTSPYSWAVSGAINTTEAKVKIQLQDNAINQNAGTDESNAKFTIDSTGPIAPVLVTLADGATTSTATPTFTWEAAIDALTNIASYEIFLDSVLFTQESTTIYTSEALAAGEHTWKIKAKDEVGNWGAYSVLRTFTVLFDAVKKKIIIAGEKQKIILNGVRQKIYGH
ncbi:MAG: DUF1565 domain-containing protein, partial [Candidatus Margulisiibacteriota bacterium]